MIATIRVGRMQSLLLTKLRRPTAAQKIVARPRLVQRLNAGLAAGRALSLVSAPAGFGKTSCVSEWLCTLLLPLSWLALDAADDEPLRFFSYVLAALQQLDPRLGRDLEGMLHAGQLPPAETVSHVLLNDLLDLPQRCLLVLDDVQFIQDSFILKVLADLLKHLPRTLHLVLIGREDPALPLARLRASNQLTEIRAADLRFQRSEIEQFLHDVMQLSLSATDVAILEERTEGWIAGLQLAALSVQDHADPAAFIATLSGSHRYILSYLTEEVLNRQPAEIRYFMLQTAILERLNGALCNAVTGRHDSQVLLEQLLEANLFLIALDDGQHWYRYHHLFADLLRDLQHRRPDIDSTALHRRAGHWYAQADMLEEAFHHALSAGDAALVRQLIETRALDLIAQWRLRTVEGWMRAIPAEWLQHSPRANLAFARLRLHYASSAAPYLERLHALLDACEGAAEPSLQAEWLALQATIANRQARPDQSLKLARRALDLAPAQETRLHSLIYLELAEAYQRLAHYEQALHAYRMIIQLGQATANLTAELLGLSGLALMALHHGQLHLAHTTALQARERLQQADVVHPICSAIDGELGQLYYQWHQLEAARRHFLRAIQVSNLSGFSDAELYYAVIQSRLFAMDGDLKAADEAIQRARALMNRVAPAQVREEVLAQQVRVLLAQQQAPVAAALLAEQGLDPADTLPVPDTGLSYQRGVLLLSALRLLLAAATDAPARARGLALATQLLAVLQQQGYLPLVLETLLLRAQLHMTGGDTPASLADYSRALELAAPQGFITVFVEAGPAVATALSELRHQLPAQVPATYLDAILTACAEHQPERVAATVPPLLEPLTGRELDVLRSMAEGLKYQEIADRLYISLNTVRFYVKNIYGKLNVNNRLKAIDSARRQGLLER